MADAPAGYMDAGPDWIERWCEDHPEAADPTGSCRSCLGESHDAWMHRAKTAEFHREKLEACLKRIEAYGDRDPEWLKRNAYIVLAECIMDAQASLAPTERASDG